MNEFEEIVDVDGDFITNNWIEWEHEDIPNSPPALREIMRLLICIFGHCLVCTSLDGCYFVTNKMPDMPQHEYCDCSIKQISNLTVKSNSSAFCDEKKFSNYIFNPKYKYNGKIEFFKNLGFNETNSLELKAEYEKQALNEYIKGNYTLHNLDIFGQRLSITINLKGQKIKTGWMVKPDGKIENSTPFSGRV